MKSLFTVILSLSFFFNALFYISASYANPCSNAVVLLTAKVKPSQKLNSISEFMNFFVSENFLSDKSSELSQMFESLYNFYNQKLESIQNDKQISANELSKITEEFLKENPEFLKQLESIITTIYQQNPQSFFEQTPNNNFKENILNLLKNNASIENFLTQTFLTKETSNSIVKTLLEKAFANLSKNSSHFFRATFINTITISSVRMVFLLAKTLSELSSPDFGPSSFSLTPLPSTVNLASVSALSGIFITLTLGTLLTKKSHWSMLYIISGIITIIAIVLIKYISTKQDEILLEKIEDFQEEVKEFDKTIKEDWQKLFDKLKEEHKKLPNPSNKPNNAYHAQFWS